MSERVYWRHPSDGEVVEQNGPAGALPLARRGWQRVHLLTDEELAAIKRDAWEDGKRAESTAWRHVFDGHPVPEGEPCDECGGRNPYRAEVGGLGE